MNTGEASIGSSSLARGTCGSHSMAATSIIAAADQNRTNFQAGQTGWLLRTQLQIFFSTAVQTYGASASPAIEEKRDADCGYASLDGIGVSLCRFCWLCGDSGQSLFLPMVIPMCAEKIT